MLDYPGKEQITVILANGQKRWLGQEAARQFSNRSALIRRAINLLMEQYEREAKE